MQKLPITKTHINASHTEMQAFNNGFACRIVLPVTDERMIEARHEVSDGTEYIRFYDEHEIMLAEAFRYV